MTDPPEAPAAAALNATIPQGMDAWRFRRATDTPDDMVPREGPETGGWYRLSGAPVSVGLTLGYVHLEQGLEAWETYSPSAAAYRVHVRRLDGEPVCDALVQWAARSFVWGGGAIEAHAEIDGSVTLVRRLARGG